MACTFATRRAASLNLHDGVPESVRSHFASVKDLVAYSWFYYPFNTTAQFLSYLSVEYALRVRLGASPQDGFKSLIRQAVEQKLITDEGFLHIKPAAEETARIVQALNLPSPPPPTKTYVETQIDVLPELRNDLAHGTHMIHPHGASHAHIAMEFINQLFSRPGFTDGH